MEFNSIFSVREPVFNPSQGESLTQQSFKDDCDINILLKRYQENPQPDLVTGNGPRVPLWGDFSDVPDVKTAHAIFQQAEVSFAALPSELRARFNNNPVEMLAFIEQAPAEQVREVFGVRAPDKLDPVIRPVDGTSAVNTETVVAEGAEGKDK